MLRLVQEAPSTVQRASGILMEYHGIDAGRAVAMLREHAARRGVEVDDVAGALVESHHLLVPSRPAGSPAPPEHDRANGKILTGVPYGKILTGVPGGMWSASQVIAGVSRRMHPWETAVPRMPPTLFVPWSAI